MTTKRRILVVDDEATLTQRIAMVLETRGYEVNVATSGEEAIAKAITHPDLILLDLVLPDLEGLEVCRRLKEQKSTQDIPIIMVSAQPMFEEKIEGLYLGADDYLAKPFDFEELFARMDTILRRSILHDDRHNDNRSKIILELRKIIKEELVRPFYQPIFYLKPFKFLGFEALVRPFGGTLLTNPEKLFKAALTYGLYCDLESLSWAKALEKRPPYLSRGKLFLNCSPYFVESSIFFKVKSLFEEHNVAPQNVVLEITERSAITDFNGFYERLRTYRDYGFELAVDDVGGGYASLESIVQVKPTIVKIDNHLILDVHKDAIKRSIVKFLVIFCKENKILSIAEGIESRDDLDVLIDLGVDAGQGYLLCRPQERINLSDVYKDLQARLPLNVPMSLSSR